MTNVFIDGKSGTTGLKIFDRLGKREDVNLLTLSEADRKNTACRAEALNSCDVAILCLPDAAAREAVDMIKNQSVKVLDTSTAHRTAAGWAYGFPELSRSFRENILKSKRIAVPGCHASGFVALVYPLVEAGVLPKNALLSCFSLTGYSGGGKSMISEYEATQRAPVFDSPRQYAMGQSHKHLPEMVSVTGLENPPLFSPVVADYYSGMEVTVPLHKCQLAAGAAFADVKAVYEAKYQGPVVTCQKTMSDGGFAASNALSGCDTMEIAIEGNDDRAVLISRFDNLGKGASGAAIQCFNLLTGAEETTGLTLSLQGE